MTDKRKAYVVGKCLLLLLVVVMVLTAGLGYSAEGIRKLEPFKPPANDPPWVENEVLVMLKPSATEADLKALNDEFGSATVHKAKYMQGLYKLRLPGPVNNDILAKMNSKGFVLVAERNYKRYVSATPDDTLYPLFRYPDYPEWLYGQWALQPDPFLNKNHIYAPEAWDIEKGKNDVVVAVIDTGVRDLPKVSEDGRIIRYPHPDLGMYRRYCPTDPDLYEFEDSQPGARISGRLLLDGCDFTSVDHFYDPSPSDSEDPDVVGTAPHGTMAAGVIAAKTNNSHGVASLCWNNVWILPLKVCPDEGWWIDVAAATDAIMYCVWYRNPWDVRGKTLRVDVINMSYGAQIPSAIERSAVAQAVASGIVMVAAAGNSGYYGPYPPTYPGAFEGVICVGSTDYKDVISVFSQRGHAVDLVAPGEDILTTYWHRLLVDEEAIDDFYEEPRICDPTLPIYTPPPPGSPPYEPLDIWGNWYIYASGTSFSSPIVAAAAALLRSLDVPPQDVEPILRETVTPVGVGRPNDAYGWGLLNVNDALKMACIDVKIQSPTQSGLVPTRRPRLRVDFRHADPDTISIWIDPDVDSDSDGIPDNAPVLTGTDLSFSSYYFPMDEAAGKAYVQFEYELAPGTHTLYARAESDMELDTPPPTPLTDNDEVAFTVVPQTLRRGWHLLSIPFRFEAGTTPEEVFASDSGVLARWHYANNAYGEYAIYSLDGSRTDPEAGFAPPSVLDEEGRFEEKLIHPWGMPYDATPPAGLGYWAYIPAPVEFPESSGQAMDTAPYVISLYNGWNMAGNPFPFMVDWASVVVDYAGTRVTMAEAVENGWIFGYIFRYDNIYRRYKSAPIVTATLKPWEAQWVRVRVRGPSGWPQPDVKLIVPPNPYTGPAN